ncbi:MerR family DNA-binding transcriptional regulator [Chelativorans sp. AA-79]|uniref:MerR family transcriptional regulator n=1 Tax=Chelativorans sp. AA-79 TaxID=3028735 RepID=UPI0023F8AF4D|nr:MerR family DNA-binding transcriptional regulator [Chelativorans sp. AA-79]WEX09091.1 MerR family DNA-binding transcriptional regulator [Chelativorans sp. AA-79]
MEVGIVGMAGGAAARKVVRDKRDHYFRIGELAREFGVTLRTLRFYEDKGLLHPRRDGLTRLYSEADRRRLKLVLRCRKIGFPLRDMKQILELYGSGGATVQQLKLFLGKAEKQMEHLENRHNEIEEAAGELASMIRDIRTRLDHGTPGLSTSSHGGLERFP